MCYSDETLWDHMWSKQIEILYLLMVLLTIPLKKLPICRARIAFKPILSSQTYKDDRHRRKIQPLERYVVWTKLKFTHITFIAANIWTMVEGSMSLPNNFSYQICMSDLPLINGVNTIYIYNKLVIN